jgi:hypothetical protein
LPTDPRQSASHSPHSLAVADKVCALRENGGTRCAVPGVIEGRRKLFCDASRLLARLREKLLMRIETTTGAERAAYRGDLRAVEGTLARWRAEAE